jgi:pSer/pThr/pTyr-binding forkhead associated (FHA) protein
MIEIFGWNVLLFVARWAFIGVLYLALFVILFAVRRELRSSVSAGRRASGVAPGRLRVIASGTDRKIKPGQVLELKAEANLGAERDNDLVLRDQFVSSHHARLRWDGNLWWLEDLGSKNGTQVNQTPAYPHMPVQVAPHARIQIGDMQFELLDA